jgi:hypothetical protein
MSTGSYGLDEPQGGSASTGVQERVQETARQATSQVQEKAQEATGQARSKLREQVDERSTQAGEQVSPMADALRKTSTQLREEGNEQPAKAADAVAERIEQLSTYLKETDSDRLLNDIENFGRRRPWALAAGGALLGFVASRFLKASSSRRYEELQERTWTAPARPGIEATTPPRATLTTEPTVADPGFPVAGTPAGRTSPESF